MLPFDPFDIAYLWWTAHRDHIKNAKRYPDQAHGYCQAAVIAQANYEMERAIRMVREYY